MRHKRIVRIGHPARLLPHIAPFALDALLAASDQTSLAADARRDLNNLLVGGVVHLTICWLMVLFFINSLLVGVVVVYSTVCWLVLWLFTQQSAGWCCGCLLNSLLVGVVVVYSTVCWLVLWLFTQQSAGWCCGCLLNSLLVGVVVVYSTVCWLVLWLFTQQSAGWCCGCLQNGCVTRLVCWWAFGCSSPCAFNLHRWLASCSQHRERESRVSVFPCQYIAYPQQVLCSAFSRLQVSVGAARPQN